MNKGKWRAINGFVMKTVSPYKSRGLNKNEKYSSDPHLIFMNDNPAEHPKS